MTIEQGQPEGAQPEGSQPSFIAPDGATIYVTRRFRVIDAAWLQDQSSDDDSDYFRVQPSHPGLDPAESDRISIELFDLCANLWQPNEHVAANEYVWPLAPTGFCYQWGGTAGRTGARQPRWPLVAGLTVRDGSGFWTCRAPDSEGLNVISDVTAVSEPAGLTIASVDVQESTRIAATYSGGTAGEVYAVAFTFTLDGRTRVVRHRVPVRRR